MDRRLFVRGLFGLTAAAVTAGVLAPDSAEAATLPVVNPDVPASEADRTDSDFRPDVDGVPSTEKAQYYYYRRRPRYYRRRRFYRRYHRPRYYRRRYYRPRYRRRVYYY